MPRSATVLALLVAVVGWAGCDAGPDPEVRDYLDAVGRIERERAAVFAPLRPDEWLAYAPRPIVLGSVPAPAPASLDGLVQEARDLDPPAPLADAHAEWVASVAATRERAADLATAVAADDLAAALVAATRDTLGANAVAAAAPAELCRVVALRPDATCPDDDEPAAFLAVPLRRVLLEAGPAIGNANVTTGSEDELLAYLEVTRTEVEAVLAEVLDELARADPPGEWREDAAVVTRYLEGLHDLAIQVTDATAAGDAAVLPGVFQASTVLVEELRSGLSTEAQAALRPLLDASM